MTNNKSIIRLLLLSLAFIVSGNNGFATNFYVSNNGDNSANGTSPETAWETIGHVNSVTFSPGDSILFRCGDRWMEYLIIPSSGNSSHYITFSSYGNGAKPKLYGSTPVTSFYAHPTRSNVYRMYVAINPYTYGASGYRGSIFYIINDSVTWGDGITLYNTNINDLDTDYEWAWQNDSVYFYFNGNISDIDTIECPQIARIIDVTKEYITIDGLDIRYAGNRCIGWMNYPEVTMHGCNIRNCHIAYSASKEEGVGYGIALGFSDIIIENNDIHDNGRRNISINLVASTGSAVMRNVIIQDNKLHDGYHTTGVDLSIHSADQVAKNIVIRRNYIYDPYNLNTDYHSEGVFLQNQTSATLDSIFVYNNAIQNNTLDGVWCYGVERVFIINNTFTGPGYSPHFGAFVYSADSTVKHTIMNNIFCNYGTASMTSFDGASNGKSILDTCDYNLYYTANNIYSTYIWYQYDGHYYYYNQWADIQALGFEEHGINPQSVNFVDSITNLTLQPSSPAIGKAKPISFVTTDIEGNPRDPLHPDMGAYEYHPDIPDNPDNSEIFEKQTLNRNLNLYPNPAKNNFIIEFSSRLNENYRIQIYNIDGIKVFEKIYFECKKQSIDISNYPHGVYFVKMITDDSVIETAKIIFQ